MDSEEGLPHDDAAKEQMRLLATKNGFAATLLEEMSRTRGSCANVSGASFPARLPPLLVVADAASGDDAAGWLEILERQAATADHSEVVSPQGEHYLHYTQSVQIARGTDAFLGAPAAR